jgi:hypothetical protein
MQIKSLFLGRLIYRRNIRLPFILKLLLVVVVTEALSGLIMSTLGLDTINIWTSVHA